MTAEEAKSYISFNIGEGIWDAEMFDGWSSEKLIKFAEYQMDRADDGANNNENSD